MPFVLGFSKVHGYAGPSDSIAIPVVLQAGDRRVALVASLDTGASHCIFERSHAEWLGLDIERGVPKTFATVDSRIQTFGHEVTINTLGIEFHSTVYFFGDANIGKNVLGRHGWLDRVRIGIVDHDQMVYVADYDEVIREP